jgi:hypothetical protein
MSYNFIDQNIVSSCLIQAHTDDSFYNPIPNQHTGFAFDGNHYTLGVQDSIASPWVASGGNLQATWWTEAQSGNPYRGDQQNFPTYGLVLLSPVSLVILDQSVPVSVATALPLWMQFILSDNTMLANDFDGAVQGFSPSSVCYADGIISVTYTPDPGNQPGYSQSQHPILTPYPAPYPVVGVDSNMVVSVDFGQDSAYLDVAV